MAGGGFRSSFFDGATSRLKSLFHAQPDPNDPQQQVRDALGILSSIPEGQLLVSSLRPDQKISIEPGRRPQNMMDVDWSGGDMKIKSYGIMLEQAPLANSVAVLAHELQHNRQLQANIMVPLSDKNIVSPTDWVMYDRAIEADATSVATDIAWKLKGAGHPEVWDAQAKLAPDVCKAYAAQAKADPSSAYDGRAQRAAYDSWYHEQRPGGQTNTQDYMSDALNMNIPADKLPGMVQNGYSMRPLAAADIGKLGALSEVNYMAAPGGKPLDDASYRAQDWTAQQGAQLSRLQRDYDGVKAATSGGPAAEAPASVAPSRPAAAPAAR